jgi:hypothetical protein
MKKALLITIIVLVIVGLAVGGFLLLRRSRGGESTPIPESETNFIEVPLEQRPFISLIPSTDGHWLTLEVSRIQDAGSLEYELLYNTAAGTSQGSISTFSLKGADVYSKKILLGSESSGHYKYDEGVTQGNLTIRLRGGLGARKFISSFHLQQADEVFTSQDGKFSLTGKAAKGFYLTAPTVGLPSPIDGEVIGGPYGVFSAGSNVVKNGGITLTLEKTEASAKIYFWNGKVWKELVGSLAADNQSISALVDSLGTFVAIVPKQ